MKTKTRWSMLTKEEQELFSRGRGCGPGKTFLFIPQFIFKASCYHHDWNYSCGGSIFDKLEADTMFFAYMLKDIAESNERWYKKLFFVAMAKFYFLFVSTFGLVFWKFGEYRAKEDILESSKTN